MRGNLANEAGRFNEVGQCWEQVPLANTNAGDSIEVPKHHSFRVRALGATTVTIDSILAAIMTNAEVIIFNAGNGDPSDDKETVTVTFGGADAVVQIGRQSDRRS